MKRRDVFHVNLNGAEGTEIRKARPAVIVSSNAVVRGCSQVQIVPLSRNHDCVRSTDVDVMFDGKPGRALVDQIRTVSKHRLLEKLGKLDCETMSRIDEAILNLLALN